MTTFEAEWRVSQAELLMGLGITPDVILKELASCDDSAARKYRPDQLRVPAGNGRESGQWAFEGLGARGGAKDPRPAGSNHSANEPNPIVTANATERTKPPWLGNLPNAQHEAGVKQAIEKLTAEGDTIYSATPLAVTVPGYSTPQVYDFFVADHATGNLVGVEVKTTQFETIFLDPTQVAKDITLIKNGGAPLTVSGNIVSGVMYVTTCEFCDSIDIRSKLLLGALEAAKIPFKYYHRGD